MPNPLGLRLTRPHVSHVWDSLSLLNTRMPIPSFKAYLTELADHPYAVRKIVRTYDEIVSTFTTDAGDRYNISFERGEKYDD